jgi:hypothetical protein
LEVPVLCTFLSSAIAIFSVILAAAFMGKRMCQFFARPLVGL